jgi:hypothetical protein
VVETVVGFGNEGSRDKSYIPGAPTTPIKPCESAIEAEALSRSSAHHSVDGFNDHRCVDLVSHLASRQTRMEDAEHFSAEELDSSDESSLESTGSGESKSMKKHKKQKGNFLTGTCLQARESLICLKGMATTI